ncbi:hypothetical protein L208DRAFT_143750 [Tricholoma matsutake]|nr:hypothetical protein L208DRAFT_143750 [Tricholoma matsutake 945]
MRTLPFLEVGKWSSVCGHTYSRSRDHVADSHMYIEAQAITITGPDRAIGRRLAMSPLSHVTSLLLCI